MLLERPQKNVDKSESVDTSVDKSANFTRYSDEGAKGSDSKALWCQNIIKIFWNY